MTDPAKIFAATYAELEGKLKNLIEAVHPILAAHRSTDGRVTEEEITLAWSAYDAARRAVERA